MITTFFDRGWRINPAGVAYAMDERQWTYQQAGEQSCQIAHALRAGGFVAEQRGAVLAPNDPTAWICVLGLWRAGMSWIPINPAYKVGEIERLLAGLRCDVVFVHADMAAHSAELRRRLPSVLQWVELNEIEAFTAGQPSSPPDPAGTDDLIAVVAPTGGTTGPAKGVLTTHRGMANALAQLMLAYDYPSGAPVVNLAAAPMTHTAGVLGLVASARGGTVTVLRRARPDALLDAIERHRVTEVFLPPTVIYRLLSTAGITSRDLSSLRHVLYGSAPMSVAKIREAIDLFGPIFTQAYGQTEAPLAISYLKSDEHHGERLASCGRPGPLARVEILSPDGELLPPGSTGEICVRGELVMAGYDDDPERSQWALRDGWLHTGDVGHFDHEGYLYMTDRLKDIIISGGLNIYPGEIEQVIWSHPAVSDCAVIGVPDEDWGEAVTAVVELVPGGAVTSEELTVRCRERLDAVRTPKRIHFVESLPRSPNGKVLKRELRDGWQ